MSVVSDIHLACYFGDLNVLRELITPANVNLVDEQGHTPLYATLLRFHEDCSRLLIERGANVREKGLLRWMWQPATIRLAVKHGAQINDLFNNTLAIEYHHQNLRHGTVLTLLDCGALPGNTRTEDYVCAFISGRRKCKTAALYATCGLKQDLPYEISRMIGMFVWSTRFQKDWQDSF
jgi:hypothetical protein